MAATLPGAPAAVDRPGRSSVRESRTHGGQLPTGMELRQLRVFDAVVRHRTVTEAAGVLGLAPSTVSQHVRSRARTLGLPQYERGSRGMRLTPAGERLQGWAHRLLDQADQARREVVGTPRTLRLGALETIAANNSSPLGRYSGAAASLPRA